MKNFSKKLRERRYELGLSQAALAEMCGLSGRSVYGYEAGEKVPRRSTVLRLAEALQVSAGYLTDDSVEGPYDEVKEKYIARAGQLYGRRGEDDVRALLQDNIALFAGGELSQNEKDAFFEAVMRAYITCKDASIASFRRQGTDEEE